MQHCDDVKYLCSKAYLNDLSDLRLGLITKQEQIKSFGALLFPRGLAYDKSGVACSSCKDAFERAVIRYGEMTERYFDEMSEYMDGQKKAEKILGALKTREYNHVLTLHYLLGEQWAEVAEKMGYSYSAIMKKARAATIELYDFIPEEYRRYTIPNSI